MISLKKKKPNKDNLKYWSTKLSLMETMHSPTPIKRTFPIKIFPSEKKKKASINDNDRNNDKAVQKIESWRD